MARRRPAWVFPVVAFLGAWLLRAWRCTWRLDGPSPRDIVARRSPPGSPGTIYLVWHSRILLGAGIYRGIGLRVLISLHGDGEFIARTVERLGFRTVRGSTTRGGARALRELVEEVRSGADVIITPDGPRGPRFRVQQGCVAAASITGAKIVPAAMEARRSKRLRSWDRFQLPGVFTKVCVRLGDPIRVPRDLDAEGIETWRRRVEEAMHDENAAASAELGIPPELPDAEPPRESAAGRGASADNSPR